MGKMCYGAHGLGLILIAERQARKACLHVRLGAHPDIWRLNAERLGLDLSQVERAILSHYHIDHSGGLRAAVPAISKARRDVGLKPLVVDLASPVITTRGIKLSPTEIAPLLPDNPSKEELEQLGAAVEMHENEHTVCDGCFYVSGRIPRDTDYEKGLPGHVTKKEGQWVDDPEIMDERFLACKVRGRGLVVFSACSHAGIVNVCVDAMGKAEAAGVAAQEKVPLLSVIGGMHLSGSEEIEGRIQATVRTWRLLIRSPFSLGIVPGEKLRSG